jgi:hypothetical protein
MTKLSPYSHTCIDRPNLPCSACDIIKADRDKNTLEICKEAVDKLTNRKLIILKRSRFSMIQKSEMIRILFDHFKELL